MGFFLVQISDKLSISEIFFLLNLRLDFLLCLIAGIIRRDLYIFH